MDLKTVIDSTPTLKKPRRTFTAEFKHPLIQQCQQPDTSVAKVASNIWSMRICYINGFVNQDQWSHH